MGYIACDIDGTISDIITPMLKKIEGKYGIKKDYNEIIEQYIEGLYPEELRGELIDFIWNNPSFLAEALPIPQSALALNLLNCFHKIYLITARSTSPRCLECNKQKIKKITLNWLADNLFYPDALMFISGSEKPNIPISFDFWIEDRITIARRVAKKYPDSKIILLDQPWNQEEIKLENIYRKKDWVEIHAFILEHSTT